MRVNNKFDDYYNWLYGINDFELRTGHKPVSRILPNNEQPTTKKQLSSLYQKKQNLRKLLILKEAKLVRKS